MCLITLMGRLVKGSMKWVEHVETMDEDFQGWHNYVHLEMERRRGRLHEVAGLHREGKEYVKQGELETTGVCGDSPGGLPPYGVIETLVVIGKN